MFRSKSKVGSYVKKDVFNSFFGVQNVRDDLIIGSDSSLYAVIDAGEGLPFYSYSDKKRKRIAECYEAFLNALDFDLQIVARSVNEDIEAKLALLESRVSYTVKQKEDKPLLKKYEQFSKWLREHVTKNCKLARKYYVVVPLKLPTFSVSSKEYASGTRLLTDRVAFVQKALKELGIVAVRLDSGQLRKMLESYVTDSVYTKEGYLIPAEWVKRFESQRMK